MWAELETEVRGAYFLFCTLKITSVTSTRGVHVQRFYSIKFTLYNLPIHSLTAQQKTSLKRKET